MEQSKKKRIYKKDYNSYLPSIVASLDKIMTSLEYDETSRVHTCERLVQFWSKDSQACLERKIKQAAKQIISSDSITPIFPSSSNINPQTEPSAVVVSDPSSDIAMLFPPEH